MKGVPHFTHERAVMPGQSRGFNAESRRRLQEADPRWRTKAIIRGVIVLFSLIGFSIFAAVIPIWDADFYWGSGPNSGDWQDGFPCGIVCNPLAQTISASAFNGTDSMISSSSLPSSGISSHSSFSSSSNSA